MWSPLYKNMTNQNDMPICWSNNSKKEEFNVSLFTFFLEKALKKTTEYFLKFLFLFESTILPINNGK